MAREVLIVNGSYFQDWLLYDTDYNWRIEADSNGTLRAMGDIGSHWMDMIQHLTGLKITALCADLAIFHKTRKRPKVAIQTFAGLRKREDEGADKPFQLDKCHALETTGEHTRALAVLLDLVAEQSDYRDARARIERLSRVKA